MRRSKVASANRKCRPEEAAADHWADWEALAVQVMAPADVVADRDLAADHQADEVRADLGRHRMGNDNLSSTPVSICAKFRHSEFSRRACSSTSLSRDPNGQIRRLNERRPKNDR